MKMQVLLAQFCLTLTGVVWGQIETQDYNNYDSNFYPQAFNTPAPPGILDPATFTIGMKQCQQRCGDGYHQCFLTCEDSQNGNLPTRAFFNAKNRKKDKWSSYLLSVLTFGFMGASPNIEEDEKLYYESPYIGAEDGMSDNICLKNCTKLFRTCYRHCVCKVKDDPPKCMGDLISSSKNEIGDLNTYTGKIEFVTKNKLESKDAAAYKFNWDDVS